MKTECFPNLKFHSGMQKEFLMLAFGNFEQYVENAPEDENYSRYLLIKADENGFIRYCLILVWLESGTRN